MRGYNILRIEKKNVEEQWFWKCIEWCVSKRLLIKLWSRRFFCLFGGFAFSEIKITFFLKVGKH